MIKSGNDRRREQRHDTEAIPLSIRGVSITTCANASYPGDVVDISSMGIKVHIPGFPNDSCEVQNGKDLMVTFTGSEFTITGQCVHNDRKESIVYIGLFIASPDDQNKYKQFLSRLGIS